MNPFAIFTTEEANASQHALNDLTIRRPAFDCLTSDTFVATIRWAAPVKFPEKELILFLLADFYNREGLKLTEAIRLSVDWRPGNPFRKLLVLGDCLPDRGARAEVEKLVGLTLMFTLSVNSEHDPYYVDVRDVSLPNDNL
ncbi:hypothetical protein NSS98_30820 [Paenibacillus sp. FSL E2-0274]|uniref:hypothetical protein n=1 Tax=Paenibacillus TaxID=44249 RepID=UPI00096F9BC2|nr:hypothetical protein [Paenibacillus odorifer]OMD12613.1 hypothetical protein BJP47_05175 [Paenibacillus odorifer]OME36239.1 hypothetical protein BSK63_03820 [Paenibacillus odorifer]